MNMVNTVLQRLKDMGMASYTILRGGLLVTCTLLLCSLAMTLAAGPKNFDTYYMHAVAQTMREMAPGILLITVTFSAWCESNAKRRT